MVLGNVNKNRRDGRDGRDVVDLFLPFYLITRDDIIDSHGVVDNDGVHNVLPLQVNIFHTQSYM